MGLSRARTASFLTLHATQFMAIPVTCPGCLKRFSVSDQFAGRTGPCPNCQKPIKIPDKSEEIVIHAPADAGPKDSAGKAILNPLRRKEVKLGMPVILGASLGSFSILAIAFGLGLSGEQPPTVLLALASVVLAVPLVILGYWFLQNDELEGFAGPQLYARCGIVSAIFAALWAVYAFVPAYVLGHESMADYSGLEMVIILPVMIAIGTVASVLALELEVAQGVLHYMLYLAVTFLLAWLAGTHLASPLGGADATTSPPPVTAPSETGSKDKPVEDEEPAKQQPQVPNLLQ